RCRAPRAPRQKRLRAPNRSIPAARLAVPRSSPPRRHDRGRGIAQSLPRRATTGARGAPPAAGSHPPQGDRRRSRRPPRGRALPPFHRQRLWPAVPLRSFAWYMPAKSGPTFEPFPAAHEGGATTHAYPRPQLRRASWLSLDGTWEFALDATNEWHSSADAKFDRSIVVPFAPETDRSGVAETGFFRACWYRRTFRAPDHAPGERVLLHFGA